MSHATCRQRFKVGLECLCRYLAYPLHIAHYTLHTPMKACCVACRHTLCASYPYIHDC
jgi:hypothetical protein